MIRIKKGIVYCQQVERHLLKDFDKLLLSINFKDYIQKGDTILIKPNICAPCFPSSGAITKPLLVVHLADKIKEYGGKPIIAESSIGNGITEKSFVVSGLKHLCKAKNLKLVNLDYDKPVQKGMFKVGSTITKANKIINFPVLKTHHNKELKVSLSLKNLMGLLWKNQKSILHVKGIEKSIIKLNLTIKPILNILDATIGMEGNGPVAGSPIRVNLILASEDRVALDSVGCSLMGIKIPEYINKAEMSGLGTTKPVITGVSITHFKKTFKEAIPYHQTWITRIRDIILSIRIFHNFLFKFSPMSKPPKLNTPFVERKLCAHCKHCSLICPFNAIKLENGFPIFNKYKCVKCYACVEICPNGALKIK